uniref:Uncharacterized protein n=1 Tax=Ananas comosus var. bracteatus TaxID=296719 RepID=A0A6V7Q5R5_ANACO|nr:unnamed protein product [Ananas comosus var. bracteatus]
MHQPELGNFRPEGPVSPSWDRSLGTLPQNQLSGTGLPSRGPVASPWGTGLSHQGPVPESKNLRTCREIQISNFLGRNSVYDPPTSVEKLGTQVKHSNLAICTGCSSKLKSSLSSNGLRPSGKTGGVGGRTHWELYLYSSHPVWLWGTGTHRGEPSEDRGKGIAP